MAEEVYPGAWWNPGAAAGFAKGRSSMRATICHFTVGRDSTTIGLRGYFNWLIARDGAIQQFAEASALTWHAGEANSVGPGIEIEYLPGVDDAVFAAPQRDACAGLIRWLEVEHHIPLEYYDGVRIPPNQMRGFISHRSVLQREGHSDFWPQEDWDQMVAPAPPPLPPLPPPKDKTVAAINYRGQLVSFRVNNQGELVETFYDGANWITLVLAGPNATGPVSTKAPARTDADIDIVENWQHPDRLDVFATAEDGGLVHAWYNGTGDFASEVL